MVERPSNRYTEGMTGVDGDVQLTDRALAERELWRALEAVHAVVYFAPDAKAVYGDLGLRGFWMGYFASRAAALGAPGPLLVAALFYGFAPRMVAKALPRAWEITEPARVLAARRALARSALTEHAAAVPADRLERAVRRLAVVVAGLDIAGRPLAAAHAELLVPEEPVAGLWHTATVLREYRGDGHVAALVDAQVDGVECHVLRARELPPQQREFRGWTEQEWSGAAARLRARGLLDAAGEPTARGRIVHEQIEQRTDRAAGVALRGLADADLTALLGALAPVARSIADAGAVPYPNAMGVARPER
jgi:hypothetical protein